MAEPALASRRRPVAKPKIGPVIPARVPLIAPIGMKRGAASSRKELTDCASFCGTMSIGMPLRPDEGSRGQAQRGEERHAEHRRDEPDDQDLHHDRRHRASLSRTGAPRTHQPDNLERGLQHHGKPAIRIGM
ncbi:MAG: hypothetical protein R3D28_20150 [Geminicoccaceae bacterium]